jgi:hypothetical protein
MLHSLTKLNCPKNKNIGLFFFFSDFNECSPQHHDTIAVAMPVFIPKQSDKFAATLNSPPLT